LGEGPAAKIRGRRRLISAVKIIAGEQGRRRPTLATAQARDACDGVEGIQLAVFGADIDDPISHRQRRSKKIAPIQKGNPPWSDLSRDLIE